MMITEERLKADAAKARTYPATAHLSTQNQERARMGFPPVGMLHIHSCSVCQIEHSSLFTTLPDGWEMRGEALNEPRCPDCARLRPAEKFADIAWAKERLPDLELVGESDVVAVSRPLPPFNVDEKARKPFIFWDDGFPAPTVCAAQEDGEWFLITISENRNLKISIRHFQEMAAAGEQLINCMQRDWTSA